MPRLTACLVFAALALSSALATAQEHHEPPEHEHHSMHASPHVHGTAWIAGFKALGVAEFVPGDAAHGGVGVSVSLERNVVDGWLEIELVGNAARVACSSCMSTMVMLGMKPVS